MNIAFVANSKKTYLFRVIADAIKDRDPGVDIFWICVADWQQRYLIESGVSSESICLIDWRVRYCNCEDGRQYKLNELVFSDRVLKYSKVEGVKYLKSVAAIFRSFCERFDIRIVFGEITWAHEILMSRICEASNGRYRYLQPQSIRIPNARFTFLEGEFQSRVADEINYFHSVEYLARFSLPIAPNPPERVATVAHEVKESYGLKFKLTLARKFLQALLGGRPASDIGIAPLTRLQRFQRTLSREIKKLSYQIVRRSAFDELEGKKFVYVTLHMQPEASIDVLGRYFEDQLVFIQNIWRQLPSDMYLVVKEHTNAVGNRGYRFFARCNELDKILILNEHIPSKLIIERSSAVFTCSGTVALEAALMGKPAFMISDVFFSCLANCYRFDYWMLRESRSFEEFVEKAMAAKKKALSPLEYSEWILRSSFDGVVDPPDSSPLLHDRSNAKTVAEGFCSVINFICKK